jgi:hypothetical protein
VVDQYRGKKNDAGLAEKSDLVISTSPKFLTHYKQYNQNVINVPQAVSSDELICDETLVSKIKKEFGKTILYIGTFSSDISLEIFEKISSSFPGHTLLLIGPEKLSESEELNRFKNLCTHPNTRYIGTKPASQLKNYVRAAEVCIIPYKFQNEKNVSIRSPLKAINYIAQKKIIISSIDCEIKELENKIIYNATNQAEFIQLLDQAIHEKLFKDEKAVDEFLAKISYDKLMDFIFSNL